jgi:geranyl-CoA carboxylase alpha subunit
MLGKLIAHAPTRGSAIRQLAYALDHTVCLGLATNRRFLSQVLRHPAFAGDAVTTAFIATHFADPVSRVDSAPTWLQALAAAATTTLAAQALPLLWQGWTSSNWVSTDALVDLGAGAQRWRLEGAPADLTARTAEVTHRIQALAQQTDRTEQTETRGSLVSAVVDGRPVGATVVHQGKIGWWLCEGIELEVVDLRLAGAGNQAQAAAGALRAPMHGRITQVLVEAGATVHAGALLLVMEAMKMEHQIHAPHAGTVKTLLACAGEQVSARQLLVELAP